MIHARTALKNKQQTARFPFAVQAFFLKQFIVEKSRGIQQRLNGSTGRHHIIPVTAAGKVIEPAPKTKVETRLNVEGGVRREEGPESWSECARHSQWQNVAGANQAAVGVRASHAKIATVYDGDVPPGSRQVISAGGADHSTTHHDDLPSSPAHVRISHLRVIGRVAEPEGTLIQ